MNKFLSHNLGGCKCDESIAGIMKLHKVAIYASNQLFKHNSIVIFERLLCSISSILAFHWINKTGGLVLNKQI
jgi:hypothetical protein